MYQAAAAAEVRPWRATGAALCANLVGIGIARFGYTPLIPALIAAGWFAPSAAVYLGAANLAGYLGGALGARALAAPIGSRATLRGAMLLTAASLFACALPFGFWWFFVWRLLSGATGGVLMALAAPAVMGAIPPARRGIAGGTIIAGIGFGTAASGTLVPWLMRWGVVATWIGFGAAALLLTAIAWNGWPMAQAGPPRPAARHIPARPALRALYLEYALSAVGLVPHMVFLVDFVARGLGRGLPAGGYHWVLFGAGALLGPLVGGHAGDRIGFAAALRLALVVQAGFVALPLVTVAAPWLELSSFAVGGVMLGIVAITLGRSRELLPGDTAAQAAAWGWCTTAFAIGQAVAGYGFSYLFAQSAEGYPLLFALAALAVILALALDLAVGLTMRRRAALG